jgi:hypothetical protein
MPPYFPESNDVLARPRPLAQGVSTRDSVTTEDIGHVVGRVHSELRLLLLQRAAIVKRIGVIKHIIVGLADVFGTDVIDKELQDLLSKTSSRGTARSDQGLTSVCRRTLMEFSEPLTTPQLCGWIQEKNPAVLARQKQPTNSVTVVLRRLVSYGEVKDGVNERDVRTWQWIGPRQRDEVVDNSLPSDPGIATDAARPSPG